MAQLHCRLQPLQVLDDIPHVRGIATPPLPPLDFVQAVALLEGVVSSCETRHKQLQGRVDEMLYRIGAKEAEVKELVEEKAVLVNRISELCEERDALNEKLSLQSLEQDTAQCSIARLGEHLHNFGANFCPQSKAHLQHGTIAEAVEACESLLCELEEVVSPQPGAQDHAARRSPTEDSTTPEREVSRPEQEQHLTETPTETRTPIGPLRAEGRDQWQGDSDTCGICGKALGKKRLTGRHHCRQCGKCVCSSCSPSSVQLDPKQGPQRTCTPCVVAAFTALQLKQGSCTTP
jgi:hypothetical protein